MEKDSKKSGTVLKVKCPRCSQEAIFDSKLNPFRPFCSERCQLIDLGNWASENYRVPVENSAPPQDDSENH
jgi:uncharacterized protein